MHETELYQRAVTAKIEKGWQIEEETSDRVTLAKRNIGSLTIHHILAIFTLWWAMGVPNLLYAAYKYFADAERTILVKPTLRLRTLIILLSIVRPILKELLTTLLGQSSPSKRTPLFVSE